VSLVVVAGAPGNTGVSTSTLLLTALAPQGQSVAMIECDPSGGDMSSWLDSSGHPSWVSAIASPDRSWESFCRHMQKLPSGQRVMVAPAQSARAATAVSEAADRYGKMLSALSDVVVFADCGRTTETTQWHRLADLVVVQVRQEPGSAYATVSRIDRTIELVRRLQQARGRVRLLVVGERPYAPAEIAELADVELLGSVPDDANAAALASGAWTIGKGPGRSRLAKAFGPIAARVVDEVTNREGKAGQVYGSGGPAQADDRFEQKDVG
jgi:MinD-like ATPase involved in chromosome partitioning or flagellar assembly